MWGWLKALGGLIKKAFQAAEKAGLTDDLVRKAKALALEAVGTNSEKRAFVLAALMKLGVPEALARLALELAVQLLKKEQPQPQPVPVPLPPAA